MISRNRLANIQNPYQGDFRKVLCVCSAGLLRSPTVAWVLSNAPYNCNTRAVGTSQEYALIPIDIVHLMWADCVIVMDENQERIVRDLYSAYNPAIEPEIYTLDIPDAYSYRDPVLITLIEQELARVKFV